LKNWWCWWWICFFSFWVYDEQWWWRVVGFSSGLVMVMMIWFSFCSCLRLMMRWFFFIFDFVLFLIFLWFGSVNWEKLRLSLPFSLLGNCAICTVSDLGLGQMKNTQFGQNCPFGPGQKIWSGLLLKIGKNIKMEKYTNKHLKLK
jgi:hypothetical protein